MAIIQSILTAVDSGVDGAAQGLYTSSVSAVYPVAKTLSVLAVVLVGINIAIQAVPVTLQNALSLIFRIGVVMIFLQGTSSYSNFEAVFGAITDAPAEYGAIVLNTFSGGSTTNLYDGLDGLYLQAVDVGQTIFDNGGWITGPFVGTWLFLIAALMAVISVIILAASKIVIGICVVLAPVAIAATLTKPSAPIFEAWVKLALGFAFVPMLAAAMGAFTLLVAQDVAPTDFSAVESMGDIVNFLVVLLLGTGLMLMVPSLASSLAVTGVGLAAVAMSTYAQARAGSKLAGKGLNSASKALTGQTAGAAMESAAGAATGGVATAATAAASAALSLAKKSMPK
ncbi:MAG: type IV secretion system protein [Martelella sp.]|uniref:type IV secretion system protein n=1 Tax=Martelella sp. TaxID=1969699 RepID=UPI0032429CF1